MLSTFFFFSFFLTYCFRFVLDVALSRPGYDPREKGVSWIPHGLDWGRGEWVGGWCCRRWNGAWWDVGSVPSSSLIPTYDLDLNVSSPLSNPSIIVHLYILFRSSARRSWNRGWYFIRHSKTTLPLQPRKEKHGSQHLCVGSRLYGLDVLTFHSYSSLISGIFYSFFKYSPRNIQFKY